jgi:Ca2+/Na+ antiporter
MSKGYLARLFDDPSLVRLQRTDIRKRLSITQGLVTLVLFGFMSFFAFRGVFESFVLTVSLLFVLLALFVIFTGRLNASTSGITEIPRRDLDEVQLELRDGAYARAYRMVGLGFIPPLLAGFGYVDGVVDVSWLIFSALLLFNIWLGAPVHILAWTLPDGEGESDPVRD